MTIKMYRNEVYGRLTIVDDFPHRVRGQTSLHYRCVCDCGRQLLISGNYLRKRKARSCGCLQKESQNKNLATNNGRILIELKIKDRFRLI